MIYCIHGTLGQGASLFKSNLSFAAVSRDVTQRSPSFREGVEYHLASAMVSQSRTKGTGIVFVDCWCNFFIYSSY